MAFELRSPLETDRLILRWFASDDLRSLASYRMRSDVARHLLWEAESEHQVHEALGRKIASIRIGEPGDVLALALVRKDTGEMIGDVILQLVSSEHRCGEIGYIVHPDHAGNGYATEACRALLDLAFGELDLHRVIGVIEPRNVASGRVLEKLGMRKEAHFVENEWVKGEWQSEAVYAILAREWAER